MIIKKLVTFDLDDTLYPESEFVKSGFHSVAKYLCELEIVSHDIFFNTAWQLFEKGTRNTIFNQTFEVLGIDFSLEQIIKLIEIYRCHFPIIKPHEKAVYLLETLKRENIILALISDGPPQTQQNKLSALGLEQYFQEIIFTGAYGPDWNKPSHLAFLELMIRTKGNSDKCIYVADNPRKDFLGPNKLGWKTIRLRCKSGLYYSEIPPWGGAPEITVNDFEELCYILL